VTVDNPALEALKGIVDEHDDQNGCTESNALFAIVNGIKTCGPFFSAALSCESMEIDKDIDEMLSSAKMLITDVHSELDRKSISISDSERAAINAFCIRVIADNWQSSQEIFDEWVLPITQALIKTGISAEYRSSDFNTLPGSEITANIIGSGDIFNALNSDPQIPFNDEVYMKCVSDLHVSCNKAVEKLTQFHIPYEDADQVRPHITIQASRIFVSIIRCEFKHFHDNQRLSSISESGDNIQFSFETVYRKFRTAMDSFVTAIYVNSRMVN